MTEFLDGLVFALASMWVVDIYLFIFRVWRVVRAGMEVGLACRLQYCSAANLPL